MRITLKRVLLVTIILSILLSPGALAETFSIRNGITFGMTKEQVKKIETMKVSSEWTDGTYLSYKNITISGIKNSILEYHFENKKLINFTMLFNDNATKATHEKDYKTLNAALKDKYGKPLGYANGKTAELVSGYLDAQISIALLDKMLGGKLQYKVTYDEWLIPTDDGKVKIEHVLFTSNEKKENSHHLYYTFFSNQVGNDI